MTFVCCVLFTIPTIIIGVFVVKPVVDGCEVEDRRCQVVAYNYTATSITVAFNLLPATDNPPFVLTYEDYTSSEFAAWTTNPNNEQVRTFFF